MPSDTLHIGQVSLPLSIYPRYIRVVPGEPTARRLVKRIGLLGFKVFLDPLSRDTWNMELFGAPQEPLYSTKGSRVFGVVIDLLREMADIGRINL